MVFNAVALIIGLLIIGFSIYYLIKDKEDPESKKIYGISALIGLIITAAVIIRIFLQVL